MKITQSSAIRKVTVAAVLGSITIILGLSGLGLLPWFSMASLTLMHIPVILGAILEGPLVGMGVGLIFGVFSMLNAALAPRAVGDILFVNPLVSVLPRVLLGFLTWVIYAGFSKLSKKWAVPVSSFLGSLLHSVLVLGIMYIILLVVPTLSDTPYLEMANNVNPDIVVDPSVANSTIGTISLSAIAFTLGVNGVPEAVVASIITCGVVFAIQGIVSRKKKSELSELE